MSAPLRWDDLSGHGDSSAWLAQTTQRQQELAQNADAGNLDGLVGQCASSEEMADLNARLQPLMPAGVNAEFSAPALARLEAAQVAATAAKLQEVEEACKVIDENKNLFQAQDHLQAKTILDDMRLQKVEKVTKQNTFVAEFADPNQQIGRKAILAAAHGEEAVAAMAISAQEPAFRKVKSDRIIQRENLVSASAAEMLEANIPKTLEKIISQLQRANEIDDEMGASITDKASAESIKAVLEASLDQETQQLAECNNFKMTAYQNVNRANAELSKAYAVLKEKEANCQKCHIAHEAARILMQRKQAAIELLQGEVAAVSDGLPSAVAACERRREAAQQNAVRLRGHATEALQEILRAAQEPLTAAALNSKIVEKWVSDLLTDKSAELAYREAEKREAEMELERLTLQMGKPQPHQDVSEIQDQRTIQVDAVDECRDRVRICAQQKDEISTLYERARQQYAMITSLQEYGLNLNEGELLQQSTMIAANSFKIYNTWLKGTRPLGFSPPSRSSSEALSTNATALQPQVMTFEDLERKWQQKKDELEREITERVLADIRLRGHIIARSDMGDSEAGSFEVVSAGASSSAA